MLKAEPTVQKYMTSMPHVVGPDATLPDARKVMENFQIRHLPIVEGRRIIGLISDRDLKMAMGTSGDQAHDVKVRDLCRADPYVVDPRAPLREVADTMAQCQYGSVMVAQNGQLVGILTRYDICRALSKIISERF